MTDRVPVKGNCVDSGPSCLVAISGSLVAETLSKLLLIVNLKDKLPFTVCKILLPVYCFNFPS